MSKFCLNLFWILLNSSGFFLYFWENGIDFFVPSSQDCIAGPGYPVFVLAGASRWAAGHKRSKLQRIVYWDLSSGLSTGCRLPASLEIILSYLCFPLLLKLFFFGRKPVLSHDLVATLLPGILGNTVFLQNDLD